MLKIVGWQPTITEGIDGWGVVAEIWQHTASNPSDEEDIERLQDDFGR